MKENKKIELKGIKLNNFGHGITLYNKKEITVPYLLPQEKGLVIIDENNKGKLVKLLSKSSLREDVNCNVYLKCGSCQLLHIKYNEQLKLKKAWVNDAFNKEKIKFNIKEIISSPINAGYRNKMQVAYKFRENKIVYGFYEEDSHRVIPLDDCLIQTKRQNEICKEVLKIMNELKITPYNEDKRSGIIRFVLIREAFKTQEILVTIVTNGEMFPGRNEFVKRLRNRCPYISTIIQNYNSRKTSIILGDQERVLFGKGYIEDTLCDIKFKISSKTFFQVNPLQAERLYNKALEMADFTKDDTVIDAYCGVGTIGMVASKGVREVIGVESNKTSVQYARMNANENKIKNIRFINQDATEFLVELAKDKVKIDGVIMDPPRSGSTVAFLESIKKLKPKKVVYISCEPTTLARDLKVLLSDYEIKDVALVDMFVNSYHIETIVLLQRKNTYDK